MNELDAILDECVRRMRTDGDSVEDCLARYPGRGTELRPLLEAAVRLTRVRAVLPSHAYKAIARAQLLEHAARKRQPLPVVMRPAWRLAFALSMLGLIAVMSTTAFAQAAVPGQALYGWKLNSEHVWRTVAADPVNVDLALADRRATELTKVASDPSLESQARQEFHEVLSRLEAEKDAQHGPEIDQALLAHQLKLSQAGIRDQKLDDLVKGKKH